MHDAGQVDGRGGHGLRKFSVCIAFPINLIRESCRECDEPGDVLHGREILLGRFKIVHSLERCAGPQWVRSIFSGSVESVRNPPQVVGEHMPVPVQGQRSRLVPEKRL